MFSPSETAGQNDSIHLDISADGRPETDEIYTIPARCGRAVRVARGQTLEIINVHGHQVCDLWAFIDANISEYMSMAHSHTAAGSIMPRTGDIMVTNNRNPILKFTDDSSAGIHDTVVAACDAVRYQQLGIKEYHDNCTDNLRMALGTLGLKLTAVPAPFNVWMNIPVAGNGTFSWEAPVSQPGDHVRFQAIEDCIAVMSACPQDVTPVNGVGVEPTELAFKVF
ncbi:MAG: DUF1989 domain-containing protein [bacterium]